jgi:hypothetical protein
MTHAIVITVICDGNRPDFVTDATTPAMAALGRAGTVFANQRGIFPSATRASSASIATGSHPLAHGLRGNSTGLPIPGGHEFHDVGKPEFYETYLRTGNCGPLVPIIEHNKQDVVSLALLFFYLLGESYGCG